MSSLKYLTQFNCTCDRCGHETMPLETDGEVTVECNICDNSRTFSRPRARPDAEVIIRRLQGYFRVDDRYGG